MKTFLLFFLIHTSFFFGFTSFANAQALVLLKDSCTCKTMPADPFEEPLAFNFGPFKDQCVDSCRFRPVKKLSAIQENKISFSKDSLVVANVLHLKNYRIANIPIESIENVEIAFEEFQPGIHHVFLKFNFNKENPVQLYDQSTFKKTTESTTAITMSVEGVPPAGRNYSLFESYQESYLLLNRLSTVETTNEWVELLKHPTVYYKMSLDKLEAKKTFTSGLQKSISLGLKEKYRLFSNNCSTNAIDFISDAKNRDLSEGSPLKRLQIALSVSGPIGALQFLKSNGLISTNE